MKPLKLFAASVALICGTSALAQSAGTTDPSNPGGMGSQSIQGTTSQGMTGQGTMPQDTMPGGMAQSQPGMSGAGSQNFAAFDSDRDGSLSPLEFAQYSMAMQAPAAGGADTSQAQRDRRSKRSGNAAVQLLNETADQFSQADQNRDMRISQDELAMMSSGSMPGSGGAWGGTSGAGTPGTGTPGTPDTGVPSTPDMMPPQPGTPDTGTGTTSPNTTTTQSGSQGSTTP